MIKKVNGYILQLINNIKSLASNKKLLILLIILFLTLTLLFSSTLILFIRKKQKKFEILDYEKQLSVNLANQIIEWVEKFDEKNSFVNEKYDRLIRGICLESELYKKLFDENIKQEDRDSILYKNMKFLEKNHGLIRVHSNYPLLHKEMEISKEELIFYILKYIRKKYQEAEFFFLKMNKFNDCKFTNIEKFFQKYDSNEIDVNKDYDFFFSQIKTLDSKFNEQFEISKQELLNQYITDYKKNKVKTSDVIIYMLQKKIISEDRIEGVVNDFYRKSYNIVDQLLKKIFEWIEGKNKKFCEGENCDHYEQIFSSLIFKIASQNHESKLIEFIDEFKKHHVVNQNIKLSDFFKSIIQKNKIKNVEFLDWVSNFVLMNAEESYYFNILLNDQTKLTSLKNDNRKFSVLHIGSNKEFVEVEKKKINSFIENIFNNSNH
jgi:hypothetical protein